MELTVAGLKTGAKLVFGRYGCIDNVYPITWLKAGKGTEFISEFVIDTLMFDSPERNSPARQFYYTGNPCYEVSNIFQFLNSSEEDWYNPMHQFDSPPGLTSATNGLRGTYTQHDGFLREFEDYEVECLDGFVGLPTTANIIGADGEARFPLFNRKGYRGRPSHDLVYNKGAQHNMGEESFCEFWLSDGNDKYVRYLDRGGRCGSTFASSCYGIRPKCKLKPDTKVELQADGTYRIAPFAVSESRSSNVCTDDEFMALMGLL